MTVSWRQWHSLTWPILLWRRLLHLQTQTNACQSHSRLWRSAAMVHSYVFFFFASQTKGWIEQGLTSHLTHFRLFRRRWGDCGISQDCSHSQSPQCVRCWVECARPHVDNSGVYVYYLKGIGSVCFRCPARTGFAGRTNFTWLYNIYSHIMQLCQFAYKMLWKSFDNILQLNVTRHCVSAILHAKTIVWVHRVFRAT